MFDLYHVNELKKAYRFYRRGPRNNMQTRRLLHGILYELKSRRNAEKDAIVNRQEGGLADEC